MTRCVLGGHFDSHRTQLSITERVPASDTVEQSGDIDTTPMTKLNLTTREMANVLFTSLAKPPSEESVESQEWQQANDHEAKWKAEVLALLSSIKEHTAAMSAPARRDDPVSNHTPDPWSRTLLSSASTNPSNAPRVCSTKVQLPQINTRTETKGKSIDLTDARKSLELAKKSLDLGRSNALVRGNDEKQVSETKDSSESAVSPVRKWAD